MTDWNDLAAGPQRGPTVLVRRVRAGDDSLAIAVIASGFVGAVAAMFDADDRRGSLTEDFGDLAGVLKIVAVEDTERAGDLVNSASGHLNETLFVSSRAEVLLGLQDQGAVTTALRLGENALSHGDLFPKQRLEACNPTFVFLPQKLMFDGLLERCGRPAIVELSDEDGLVNALAYPDVVAAVPSDFATAIGARDIGRSRDGGPSHA